VNRTLPACEQPPVDGAGSVQARPVQTRPTLAQRPAPPVRQRPIMDDDLFVGGGVG